jgi:drug/metabolite transporter (DMT)-like permease
VTPTAVLLIGISAILHASWNMLGRRERSTVRFYFTANLVGWLCLLPVLAVAARALPTMVAASWPLLVATGFFQALYYASLSAAYRDGELSQVYPVVRSAAVVFVTLAGLALGRGGDLGPLAAAGIVLVVAGIVLLGLKGLRSRGAVPLCSRGAVPLCSRGTVPLRSRGILFGLLAAVGTAGYSLFDDRALRLLRSALAPQSPTVTTLLYALLEGAATSLWLGAFVAIRAARRPAREDAPVRLGPAALSGAAIFAAYTLVLVAMGFARNVTYVVAFRQVSIPIGVLLGLVALREPLTVPKAVGALAVTAGLVLVAVG